MYGQHFAYNLRHYRETAKPLECAGIYLLNEEKRSKKLKNLQYNHTVQTNNNINLKYDKLLNIKLPLKLNTLLK